MPEVYTVWRVVRVHHVTYVIPSLTTLFGGRLRKHIFQPPKSRLDCLEVMVKDLTEQHWFLGRGKPLAWDVTVPDTYAASHIQATAISAGAAAEKASDNKRVKYNYLATTHIFVPIDVETSGAWCSQSA